MLPNFSHNRGPEDLFQALEDLAEIATAAIGGQAAFICFEDEERQHLVTTQGLDERSALLVRALCRRHLRSHEKQLPGRRASPCSDGGSDELPWHLIPVVDRHQHRIGIFGFCRDPADIDDLSNRQERVLALALDRIGDWIGLNRSLRESEQHYQSAMELDPLVRWTADAQGNLLDLNGRWQELTGGERNRALGGAWRRHVHRGDRNAALRAFETALRQGTPIDVRFRLRTAEGEWRWTRTRAQPWRNQRGDLLRWYGTTEDVHDQITAERALRDSSAQLETVINQAMVGILHRDLEERVLTVNDRYCELIGRSPIELDGLPMASFTHPADIDWNARLYAEHIASGRPFQIEKRYLRPDGSSLWCAVHVSFVKDEEGVPRSTITVAQDITDRRRAEEELRESKELLQTVIDSVSDLIFVKDRDGDFVLANRSMREGCIELSPQASPEFFDSNIYRGYRAADERVMRSGEPIAFDEMILFHGDLRPFETIKVPWRKSEQIAGVIGISRDIAARLKSEAALRESEEHYRYSVELNPQVPWTAAPNGAVEEVGPRWSDFTGGDPRQARGNGWHAALHPDDAPMVITHWNRAVTARVPIDVEYRLRRSDGSYRWVRARSAPRLDAEGKVVRWYGTLEDVDEHHRAQEALQKNEERFRLAVQAAKLGIWDYDTRRGTHQWSTEFRNIIGVSIDTEALPETAFALVHPDDRHHVLMLADAAAVPTGNPRFTMSFRILRGDDGEERWLCADGWRSKDVSGNLERILVAVRDVTDVRTADDRIRWAARHDALTGLPNRAAFQDRLEEAIARAAHHRGMVGLLLVDLDYLKEINDCLGHDAGDAALCHVGARLAAAADGKAFIARLGGDEFALLFSGQSVEQDLAQTVGSLASILAEPFVHDGRILDCRATSGGCLFPRDGENGAELLKAADLALYAAKARARGGLLMFRSEMKADLQRRSSMVGEARAAIDDERVTPFFQPKIELSSGKIAGFEALLRWHHPETGYRLPGDIAAAFDNLDVAQALSDRMFDRAIDHMRRWLDDGVEFGTIAVNAAAAEFRHDDLAERILERLDRMGVPPARLEVEVTETVFLGSGADYVDRALRCLSEAGVKIALDDFGTGYASLSHLKQYPVDIIKIDRSFVSDLESAAGDAAIVKAVINLGNSLGMGIVAEGIETMTQASYLLDQGCQFGQGYLFGRATPPTAIAPLVATWRLVRIPPVTFEGGRRE